MPVMKAERLVAQAGASPVEGYSNPLYVLVLAGLARLHLVDLDRGPGLIGECVEAIRARKS
jgi:hypothetical protein